MLQTLYQSNYYSCVRRRTDPAKVHSNNGELFVGTGKWHFECVFNIELRYLLWHFTFAMALASLSCFL